MLKLYKSFIRPNLEYASIVWSPHLKCNIEGMEKTQKFALKVCLKKWGNSFSYLGLLHQADLRSLGDRRSLASLYHLYKLLFKICDYPEDTLQKRHLPYNTRHVNELSLAPVSCRTSVYKNSFFPKTIELWNKIVAKCDLSACTSLESFKTILNDPSVLSML